MYHFVGVQIVKAEVFRPLPPGQPVQSTRGAYDELIARRPGSVRGFVSRASFWDVGTIADYWNTSWAFAAGSEAVLHGARTRLASSSIVSHSILWDDVVIGERCELDECIVADHVSVPPGTRLRRTIVTRGPDGQNRTAPF